MLPAGWVTPFWMALVHAGAKPAGQREWHWVHTLQGRPFFPQDFPDTQVRRTRSRCAVPAFPSVAGAEQAWRVSPAL